MSQTAKWYHWFRQTTPKAAGGWVLCGAFETYEDARRDRENSKAWDAELSTPFSVSSREDAEKNPPS
jgi:hypothetical protein